MKRYRRSIFFKLTAITILISVVPIALLTVNSLKTAKNYINNESITSYQHIAGQYSAGIDYKMGYYYDILSLLSANTSIQNALTNESASSNSYLRGLTVTNEISKYISTERLYSMENCMIYSSLSNNPIYHKMVTMEDHVINDSWYSIYKATEGSYFLYNKTASESLTLSLCSPIISTNFYNRYYASKLGFIKLDIKVSSLFMPETYEKSPLNYQTYIVSENYDIIYSTSPKSEESLYGTVVYSVLSGENSEGYFTTVSNTNVYVIVEPLSYCNMNAVLIFPTDAELIHINQNLHTMLWLLALSTVFVIICYTLYSRLFTSRIQLLLNKMKQVEAGNTKITLSQNRKNDEITDLEKGFDRMVTALELSIQKNYVAELEKKEAQLRSLQLQINPHFLYNTLETIGAIAMSHKIYAIGDLCERLGNMFRYVTNKEKLDFVKVADEIHHTENYVEIQKVRFQNLFEVYYSVDPALEGCSIPRFILQPVVENAILHGLKKQSGEGWLEVSVYREDANCVISVTDDGVGMTEAQVDYLNNYINALDDNIAEGHKQSIGFKNVNMRLKLIYGPEYGLTIESKPGQGTRVYIKLPFNPVK